eukprot:SAG31_NODE_1453_length_8285_cov_11.761544_5_plen_62_part_00
MHHQARELLTLAERADDRAGGIIETEALKAYGSCIAPFFAQLDDGLGSASVGRCVLCADTS